MKGIEMATRKRKGRMTRTSLPRWANGSLAQRAILIRTIAKSPKRRKEFG
jgi:hypothetical protein